MSIQHEIIEAKHNTYVTHVHEHFDRAVASILTTLGIIYYTFFLHGWQKKTHERIYKFIGASGYDYNKDKR